MKSILEKALVHLLNEEHEQAQELFHQFVVSRAKEIHESLREGDEMDENCDESALEEEFFTEADLEDAEAADNLADDLDDNTVSDSDLTGDTDDTDMGDTDMGDTDMGDTDMGDTDDTDMDGSEDTADRLDDLEDEIKALQAEFDRVMAEFDDDDSTDDTTNDTMDTNSEVDGEDFDDVTESMVNDLKKVSVDNTDGRGANGEKLSTPTKSPIAPKGAKPHVAVSKNNVGHTGFDREKAPVAKSGPDRGRSYTNDRKKATDGNSPIPASGPKGAELAKPIAGNTKSVISGKKDGSK